MEVPRIYVYIFILLAVVERISAQTSDSIACIDTIQSCDFLFINSMCDANIEKMKMKCDRTCGWCSDGDECIDAAKYIDCSRLSSRECTENAVFYRSRCKKSCNWCKRKKRGWTKWSQWTDCPSDCEVSERRRRTRKCAGEICVGPDNENEECPCATWSKWGSWETCSATCDKGVSLRRRECTGGTGCEGESTESEKCKITACKGVLGPWGEWSECSASCGPGTRLRTRTCNVTRCKGNKERSRPCTIEECPTDPAPGEVGPRWSVWAAWTECSATCGQGASVRRRTCITGRDCEGQPVEVKDCLVAECETDWGPWGEWSQCSESCGEGYRIKLRKCSKEVCEEGRNSTSESCTIRSCPYWFDWNPWSSCSVRCGKGTRKRTRECNNGPGCEGPKKQKKNCQMPSCSGEGPQFDVWSDCSKTCSGGMRSKLSICEEMDVNVCPTIFEECNTTPCKPVTCPRSFYHRYGYQFDSCCEGETSECGRNKRVQRRVLGGVTSKTERFPWVVRLELDPVPPGYENWVCTGTLVHRRHVVTAAHCTEDAHGRPWPVEDLVVVLGSDSLTDNSSYVQRVPLAEIIRHPEYKYPANDIGILKLEAPVTTNSRVNVICTPNGEETPADKRCVAAGWGVTSNIETSGSQYLMEVVLRHLPFGICKEAYENEVEVDDKIMMCVGVMSGEKDTCQGDSGGPLMCQRCSSCAWYLAGVTSFGPLRCGSAGRPGVYVRVNQYQDWISDEVNDLPESEEHAC